MRALPARASLPEAPSGSGYALDRQVGFILRQVQQRHAAIFAAAFGETTPLQWSAIAKLADIGECSQNLLGRLIATDVATIKGVVERLMRRGLVENRPDPADRRRVLLTLSDTGHALYGACREQAHQVTRETLKPLGSDEQAILVALLDRLR